MAGLTLVGALVATGCSQHQAEAVSPSVGAQAKVSSKLTVGAGTLAVFAGVPSSIGSADGTGAAARFSYPYGVAVEGSGNVYVADTSNYTIRKITPAGVVTTLAGTAGAWGSADGTGAAARFNGPYGVAVDGAGNVYVAEIFNQTIRKITPAGVVTTLAGAARSTGSADGTGAAARFNGPYGVAVDGSGNVYVADNFNNTIRKITPAGVVTTLAGTAGPTGSADGTGAAARFNSPRGVAVDGSGNVYVADTSNYTIRKVTPAGVVTTLAGTTGSIGSADRTGAAARFNNPFGVSVDGSGNVYVADYSNSTIRKITPAGVVSTLAGTAGSTGSTDGTGAAARFYNPWGFAVGGSGNVYVADTWNHTIRKITPAGVVSTFAGTALASGSADGTGAAARFNGPVGVAVDGSGNVYVADTNNSTIRKITPAGVVTTLAGTTGLIGSTDGTGAAARFSYPYGVAVDGSGSVYVADTSNYTIRKITPIGVVTTLAGTALASGSADGTGAAARFNNPFGVSVDGSGNVFVADTGNSTIRKITPAGVVSTLAGTAGTSGSADGTGSAARLNNPSGVAVDGSGNVYVADMNNSAIRKSTPAGVVTTLVGSPSTVMMGNFPGPLPASLVQPGGVAVDQTTGSLYITVDSAVLVASNTLTMSPAVATVSTGGQRAFSASGGVGLYTWSLDVNNSGGTISSAGLYTAGPIRGVADTVAVRDSMGSLASAVVTVPAPLVASPQTAYVVPGMERAFGASGGIPPYTWTLSSSFSLGSITSDGHYTAGLIFGSGLPSNPTDVALVTDSMGATTSIPVLVFPPVEIFPSNFTVDPGFQAQVIAHGGASQYGAPFAYTWTTSSQGACGGIVPQTLPLAIYQAGPAGNCTDTVTFTDVATGASASAAVTVPAPLTVSPGGGTMIVSAGGQITLFAAGGSGPYTWTITTNNSGGSVTSGGVYTAGPNGGTDTITLTDANGGTTTISVASVRPACQSATACSIVGWGSNASGQISPPPGLGAVKAMSSNDAHALAVKNDGTVVAWGLNDVGQTNVPAGLTGVVSVAAGGGYSLALKADGTVVAWGKNDTGQATVPPSLSGVVGIAAGYLHSAALKSDGSVVVWGANGLGQTAVPPSLGGVIGIAAGGWHTLAVKSDGTVVAWGWGGRGQSTVPGGLSTVVGVAAGADHSVALKSDGTVVAWGSNDYGQGAVPPGVSGVTAIASGAYHNVARKSDGTVVAWGRNDSGQATAPSGLNSATAVAAGAYHSLAVTLAAPVAISPVAVTVEPGLQSAFTASGGTPPYSWALSTNGSGGSISSAGLYTAGPTGSVTDTVTVTDSLGRFASSTVTVPTRLAIAFPGGNASIAAGGQVTLTASGGTGPYVWTMTSSGSGGSVTWGGIYLAGAGVGTDTITVTDANGATATVTITVNATPMRVFVTSQAFDANLGGTAGADQKCQQLAATAGLSGTYKAWLSVFGDGGPAVRFTHAVTPYVLVDGTVVANSWADLVSMAVLHSPIHLTETGGAPPSGSIVGYFNSLYPLVWTNTTDEGFDGYAGADCNGWTRVGPGGSAFGNPLWDAYWSVYAGGGTNSCAYTAPFYCFEQPQPAPHLHFIGGRVNGQGDGLVLATHGQQVQADSVNGRKSAFLFSIPVPSGTPYDVSVVVQPALQTCTVSGGSGTVGDSDVGSIAVDCRVNTYAIGGTVAGLVGSGLTVSLITPMGSPPSQSLSIVPGASQYAFTVGAHYGPYTVQVMTQPVAPAQTCVVANGSGWFAAADVTSASINCTTNPTITTGGGGPITVGPGGQQVFSATGGTGPYTWTLSVNNSGGSITPGGVYTAGPNAGTDTITVTDSAGGSTTITITVTGTPPAGGEAHGAPALSAGHVGLTAIALFVLGLAMAGPRGRARRR
jgi:streptogramin lyase